MTFVDGVANSFVANLINLEDADDKLKAEFDLDDVYYKSDLELVREGALFIWLIGKEFKLGTATNVAKLIFRRTPIVNEKDMQEAKKNAKIWAEFFNGL